MSWLRRLLLLAGLMTGAWLLGSAGEANADVKVEIDQLRVEVKLPVADIGLKVETGLVPRQPEAPAPPTPDPRTEIPAPLVAPRTSPQPVVEAPPPVQAEVPQQQHAPPSLTTQPANPAPVPQQPQPQAEPPVSGTLPQSGAGQASGSQIPAGTLPHVMRPPVTTTSLVSTEQLDAPRTLRAEEPTFSPD
jgi:hypothetical protein